RAAQPGPGPSADLILAHPAADLDHDRPLVPRADLELLARGVREYEVGGRAVLDPYPLERPCDGAHGAPLIPWPNRLAGGRYSFDGEEHQVALTEPVKGNAIHGFLRWRSWRAVEREPDRVVMATRLHPLPGYPWTLDVRVAYELAPEGLVVWTTAENLGEHACPYGHGQHPYLSPGPAVGAEGAAGGVEVGAAGTGGGALIDGCTLQAPGRTRVVTDSERQLPTGTEPVVGTRFDFTEPRALGEATIDFAFCDLDRDAGGRAWTRLCGPDGASAEIWVDESFPFVELYTGDTLAPDRARRGLGTEPMTCAPNALATGWGLIRLEPGERAVTTWGARLR
ncbi:MAG TPA: aldose 1-epimerase family protein, partial [Solirubrobacterales bacterium]|nr:aldose 1-epimerase family protein [Solirubrobacterales bacterium]